MASDALVSSNPVRIPSNRAVERYHSPTSGRTTTMVLHSIKKVEEEMKIKKEFKTTVEKIEAGIKST